MIGQLDRISELENLSGSKKNVFNKLLAVTSGKGGTGKTFFAANFAYQYSVSHKVLLIDLDFNLSNLHLLFNTYPQKTLSAYFDSKALFGEIIINYKPDLDIIFGDAGLTDGEKPTLYQLEKMLDEINNLADKYDLIVLDLGAGVSEENLFILSKAKTKLIITNPEPTALMDAYVLIKLLKYNNTIGGLHVVVNRCIEEDEASKTFGNLKAAVDNFLKVEIEFLSGIPESSDVRKSIVDQKLLVENDNSSKPINSIQTIVNKISKIHQVLNINQSVSSSSF